MQQPAAMDWADDAGDAPVTRPTGRSSEATLADAFRSAPSIVGAPPAAQHPGENTPVQQRPSSPKGRLRSSADSSEVRFFSFYLERKQVFRTRQSALGSTARFASAPFESLELTVPSWAFSRSTPRCAWRRTSVST